MAFQDKIKGGLSDLKDKVKPSNSSGGDNSPKKRRFPSFSQWKRFFSVLNRKERLFFTAFCLLFLGSFLPLSWHTYTTYTVSAPANGGVFREGVLGQPKFINPLYLSSQDADRDIVEVIFSGLMKYNESGELVNDLASDYQASSDGREIEVTLKDNVLWHDGEQFTADDVVFTTNLVQDPQAQSPLRVQWMGIAVEKVSDYKVRFRLPKAYSGFKETLTLKILPKHILKDIAPADLPWKLISENFLVGTGPFVFQKIDQASSGVTSKVILKRNDDYYNGAPYLDDLEFIFYEDASDLLKAQRTGDIDGFALGDAKDLKSSTNDFTAKTILIPRYFALFFNLQKNSIFNDKDLREAVSLAVNIDDILKVFSDKATASLSAILPNFYGFNAPNQPIAFDKARAEEILDNLGYVLNPATGKREKQNTASDFTFTRNLVLGSTGGDVEKLQECLANPPAGGSDIYPEGKITGEYGPLTKAAVIRFQEKYAADILTPIGLSRGTGDVKPMTIDKLNEVCFTKEVEATPLELTLTTGEKFPLDEISQVIKNNLENIGITVEIDQLALADLQSQALNKREFEFLLFGEALGATPDPFPFWHSSQKDYPGLNISSYESKTADTLLEQARETDDATQKQEYLEEFQNVLLNDSPAVFLASPDYIYLISNQVRGFNMQKITEPAKRFSDVERWYMKTKRVWQ